MIQKSTDYLTSTSSLSTRLCEAMISPCQGCGGNAQDRPALPSRPPCKCGASEARRFERIPKTKNGPAVSR